MISLQIIQKKRIGMALKLYQYRKRDEKGNTNDIEDACQNYPIAFPLLQKFGNLLLSILRREVGKTFRIFRLFLVVIVAGLELVKLENAAAIKTGVLRLPAADEPGVDALLAEQESAKKSFSGTEPLDLLGYIMASALRAIDWIFVFHTNINLSPEFENNPGLSQQLN